MGLSTSGINLSEFTVCFTYEIVITRGDCVGPVLQFTLNFIGMLVCITMWHITRVEALKYFEYLTRGG
jgi:hypothetical protein